jgi:hypothetical protein
LPNDCFGKDIYHSGRAYVFSRVLPGVDRATYENPDSFDCPEWGTPAISSNERSFSVNDLEEFKSTSLDYLTTFRRGGISPPGGGRESSPVGPERTSHTPKHALPTPEHPPAKRKKLDISSLRKIIPQVNYPARVSLILTQISPQPHFRCAPTTKPRVPVNPLIAPFRKTTPRPISPHISSTIRDYLQMPYAQSAWIVPVRGVLPWEGCSSATVLAPTAQQEGPVPDLPQPVDEMNQIAWTHPSLLDFWSFLLAVREANTLGPIALSFYTASIRTQESSSLSLSPEIFNHRQPVSGVSYTDDEATDSVVTAECRTPLLDVDHLKVYHDVAYAMLIRNVLDAWSYQYPVSKGPPEHPKMNQHMDSTGKATPEKPRKIRVLKGAALALVDERSKGVLIS